MQKKLIGVASALSLAFCVAAICLWVYADEAARAENAALLARVLDQNQAVQKAQNVAESFTDQHPNPSAVEMAHINELTIECVRLGVETNRRVSLMLAGPSRSPKYGLWAFVAAILSLYWLFSRRLEKEKRFS